MNAEPLSCADFLPLAWKPTRAPLAAAEREALSAENQQVLAAVGAMEDHRKPADEEASLENEVALLHQKMNLLLELVSHLALAQAPRPPSLAVRLSSQDLNCQGLIADPGEGIVELYLHRCIARPLRLPALLAPPDAGGNTRLSFIALDESCTAALERHVFLHHRRSVAEARLSQKR